MRGLYRSLRCRHCSRYPFESTSRVSFFDPRPPTPLRTDFVNYLLHAYFVRIQIAEENKKTIAVDMKYLTGIFSLSLLMKLTLASPTACGAPEAAVSSDAATSAGVPPVRRSERFCANLLTSRQLCSREHAALPWVGCFSAIKRLQMDRRIADRPTDR